MTDDLVKRLRDYAEQWKVSTFPNIADEAADRIEQLEAALRMLIEAHENDWHPMKVNGAEWFTARAALGEKKDD